MGGTRNERNGEESGGMERGGDKGIRWERGGEERGEKEESSLSASRLRSIMGDNRVPPFVNLPRSHFPQPFWLKRFS